MRHPEANPATEAAPPDGVPPASIAEVANALLAAADMPSLAALLVEHLGAVPGCDEVAMQWWVGGPRERCQFPDRELDAAGLALAEVAFATPEEQTRSADGRRFALAIPTGDPRAAAFLLGSGSGNPEDLLPPLLRSCVTAALEKARLRDSVERLVQADKLQDALFAIADMASSDLEMSEMLAWLHEIIGSFMYAENFYIALYDDREEMVRFHYVVDLRDDSLDDISRRDIPLRELEGSLTWYLIHDAHPLMGSTEQLRRQVSGPLRDMGVDSYDWLGVPMISGGKVRGVMVVQSYVERPRFTAKDQALLSFVSNHVLTALDRKQAHEELEQRVAQRTSELTIEVEERQRSEQLQATLFRLAKLSHTAMGLSEFYSSVHRIVGDLLDNRNFYIAMLSEDGSELDFPYFVDEIHPRPPPRKLGRGITEYVLRGGQPLLVDRSDEESLAEVRRLIDAGEIVGEDPRTVSWLGVPLVCSGRVVGVLAMQSYTSGNYYLPRDQHLLTFISYQIATGLERQLSAASLAMAYVNLEFRVVERTRELSEQIAEREKVEQRLKHEVLHDSLTGLPNRAYLRDQLVRTTERRRRDPHRKFAVLFIDLDRFKVINDSEGHSVGDALLREVAVRMTSCMRSSDMVARLGGDEFALLLDDIAGAEDALFVAHRITERLREPVYIEGKELFTAASIGIAVSGEHHQTAEELLRDADIAMYRAKANQQQRFEMFDEALHKEALQLLDLESDLRRAITRREFEPYFQPIIQLADNVVVGYEALLRWNHPSRGVLAPGAFLAVAEANGSLEEIDWLMFQAVFAVIPKLLQPGQYVNLNLSPRHFRSHDLDTRLLALLDAAGVAPGQVRLELTEGALIDKPERASEMIDRLRKAGVLAALDDFGTGYSSLSYLHRFRLHTVKIDRSFVVDLAPGVASGGSAVVRAILALALSLGLDVVAEGIETEEQRESLLALGCTFGQGYLFARPQSLATILASLEAG